MALIILNLDFIGIWFHLGFFLVIFYYLFIFKSPTFFILTFVPPIINVRLDFEQPSRLKKIKVNIPFMG